MVGPNRSKRAQILSDVSVHTVASARGMSRHEMEAFQRLFFDSSGKPLKRFRSHRRVSHRAEATVLMLLLYRGSELFGTWDSMPLSD